MRSTAFTALITLVVVGLTAVPAAGQGLLPDLVADDVTQVTVETNQDANWDNPTGERRLLMRFTGFVHNQGPGALEVQGTNGTDGVMGSVVQNVLSAGGTVERTRDLGTGRVVYESTDGHNHWHFQQAALYSLWSADGSAPVGPGMKVGFCLLDSERRGAPPGSEVYGEMPYDDFCNDGDPDATSMTMGVSALFRDIYGRHLPFQWVDVSRVLPGWYRLRSAMDPAGVLEEADESNNANPGRSVPVPGYVAQPVVADATHGPVDLTLASASFPDPTGEAPDPPEYRIDAAPRAGTLDVAVGEWFTDPVVRYTPGPQSRTSDAFTFSARQVHSGFPLEPARAVATVAVPETASVAVSGLPRKVPARTSVQLTATVLHDPGAVTWSVNGLPGGNARVGTVTPAGRYRSPRTVPADPKVTIRATSPNGAVGRATTRIVPAAKAIPSPSAEPRSRSVLATSARRAGRRLVVSTRPRRAGRLRVTLRYGAHGRRSVCVLAVRSGKRYACRLLLRKGLHGPLRVYVTLRVRSSGELERRRIVVGARAAHHDGSH